MKLKHSTAFNFAVFVLCTIAAVRFPPSWLVFMLAALAVANGFYFVVNLCAFIETHSARANGSDGEGEQVSPVRG